MCNDINQSLYVWKTTDSQVNTMYKLMLLPERLERQMEEGFFEVQNADRICISFWGRGGRCGS